MQNFLWVLLILVFIGVIAWVILYSMKTTRDRITASRILQYGRQREYFVYEMLQSAMPDGTVFRNVFVPVKTKEGIFCTEVDIICVTRGGIIALEIKGNKGQIHNPKGEVWTQTYRDKVLKFHSPYEQNESHVRAIAKLLERRGISGVPVYNYVVFADENVTFTRKYPWLLKANEVVDKVLRHNNDLNLTRRDVTNLCSLMRSFRKPRYETFTHKHKREANQKKGRNKR